MIHTFRADGIRLSFGMRRILSDVYIGCETGKITGLLGRNGQGKSCLMNIMYGSLKTVDKSVRIDQLYLPEAFRRPDLLSYLPQFNFMPKQLNLKRVFADFELPYDHFEHHFPALRSKYKDSIGSLSGGQRRITEVYCLVMSRSLFTMLDEPFSHISPREIETIKEILSEEKVRKGFLITDHMYQHIIDCCEPVYVLQNGKTHLTKSRSDIEKLGYLSASC
jgi:ABC-type multidrug transport system ATPase subunit